MLSDVRVALASPGLDESEIDKVHDLIEQTEGLNTSLVVWDRHAEEAEVVMWFDALTPSEAHDRAKQALADALQSLALTT